MPSAPREDTKRPFASKKWTAFMWVHTTLVGFLVFHELTARHTDAVALATLSILGGLDVLYLGGVYALDRYRLGVVDVVRAITHTQGDGSEE